MSDIVYLTVSGEQQGAISAGCGTIASVGNRWQTGHEDEIFVFSLSNSITSTGKGSHLHGLRFCKLIDKSTPLFVNAINNNEQLYMEFYFYRINRFGRWEKYYYIQLRGAFLSGIQHQFSENNLDTETITISYEYILCKHLIANTEFSYLALPANYNRLFVPPLNPGLKTLNSKAVGRLLAAGGVYNGNIEGFRETAEKLGGDAIKGYDQILNEQTTGTAIAAASILLAKTPIFKELKELNGYIGIIRGEMKLLQSVDIKQINYIKRNSIETTQLRKEFNNSVRKNFLRKISHTSEASELFSPNELNQMAKGTPPFGWEVHHKLPLDDSGSNSFDNLSLIEKESHKVITNFQRTSTNGMQSGNSKLMPWVQPIGSIYKIK